MKTASNSRVLRTIPLILIMALFLSFAHAGTVQWQICDGGNGHFYQPVYVPKGISWSQAKMEAELAGGHLVTIASAEENEFVFSLIDEEKYWHNFDEFNNHGPWIGGFQLDGATEPAGGWTWVTDEKFLYTAWLVREPSGQWGQRNENRLQYSALNNQRTPTWNDLIDELPLEYAVWGYIIEFPQRTIYVDDDAMGADDGTSWENAYNFLQDALADANSAPKPVEIQVAQGVYTPDSNSAMPDGTGDREATFRLINGVTLQGGYAGIAEPDPDARDVAAYETILSGDLNGDDVEEEEPTRAENSYHVVTGSSTDQTAVLDGFTITGGHADGPTSGDEWPWKHRLQCGSGMYNSEGSPTLTNCTFSSNTADFDGGGMYNYFNSSPTLTNCTFSGNSAAMGGGGMNNYHSSPTLNNCTFSGNSAEAVSGEPGGPGGGGMFNWYNSSPTLNNCTFTGNSAEGSGGGMYNFESSPTLNNCTFTGNSAEGSGGGMNNYHSSPTLNNCTFSGNSAYGNNNGGGMQNSGGSPTLTDCILWGNAPEQIRGDAAVTYSDVQGGWPGEGNIDTDPLFAALAYWHDNNTPDNPRDDYWVDGDYHLKSQAGRWDSNSQTWVQDDVSSPCIDAGDANTCIGFEPNPNGDVINMGAYGGTTEASLSPSGISCISADHPDYDEWIEVGEPVCWCYQRQCHGDTDGKPQGKQQYWVSTDDLDVLIAAWSKPFSEIDGQRVNNVPLICADFNHEAQGTENYRVSTNDLDILIANWNKANKPDPNCP